MSVPGRRWGPRAGWPVPKLVVRNLWRPAVRGDLFLPRGLMHLLRADDACRELGGLPRLSRGVRRADDRCRRVRALRLPRRSREPPCGWRRDSGRRGGARRRLVVSHAGPRVSTDASRVRCDLHRAIVASLRIWRRSPSDLQRRGAVPDRKVVRRFGRRARARRIYARPGSRRPVQPRSRTRSMEASRAPSAVPNASTGRGIATARAPALAWSRRSDVTPSRSRVVRSRDRRMGRRATRTPDARTGVSAVAS